ncbi:MAG: CTP-dependent riboflavin kinase [Thermoplasmatales archaeon]|nr:CTP-dependent riboflavin kinase [Candidatus Thermoplasmatota archaeon]MCL6002775.1 CTP-dependent riboflavin kinase [Candidatus Thermoplasmatota archaeon]MDA8056150.1 CTP-dependent riboflavin kinase [Thermoplasmatales archaeon]
MEFLKNISLNHKGGKKILNTAELAKDLNISQQSVSRYLINLETEGYIVRRRISRGEEVTLTQKTFDELKSQLNTIQYILSSTKEIIVEGTLFTGLGEGSYYISRDGYVMKIKEYLKFEPFPGTMNLRLTDDFSSFSPIVNNIPGLEVEPFEQDGRKFGAIKLLKAEMFDTKVGIVLPERTHYDKVLEIISPNNLRKRFNLKDGDKIRITIHKEE